MWRLQTSPTTYEITRTADSHNLIKVLWVIETNKTRQFGHEEEINLWSVILKRRYNLGNPGLDGSVLLHFLKKYGCDDPYRIYVPEKRVQ
jgi:hypothetical protein